MRVRIEKVGVKKGKVEICNYILIIKHLSTTNTISEKNLKIINTNSSEKSPYAQ